MVTTWNKGVASEENNVETHAMLQQLMASIATLQEQNQQLQLQIRRSRLN
ncbi:hypothetical protein SESBI_16229 [Sesbania bispinosa]|nr:hypothetical protein SESBI_16229 [Sesbania bispinosa]